MYLITCILVQQTKDKTTIDVMLNDEIDPSPVTRYMTSRPGSVHLYLDDVPLGGFTEEFTALLDKYGLKP